ncbi:ABC transporter ATP-binding protein [Meridianimarinicoccus roseus]|uniref:ABC transporter ATP-binding protein n=1 Tax=Meridianimarinicoccus roseus TaxID=2072018 RepID=A0A2V2LJF5_9RHOB|nr:ABC transporter ATP-binding protein [Meridianimarinicoccus roseus]PWR02489.1 ABC transporter ATP-binding protein [Meridianimarinicoccus roseus]
MSLKLTDIVKRFKTETVLDGVSLSVGRGETLVLFGPSGAGKTVLLRLIAGVVDPDGGTIEIEGRDMDGVEPEDRGIGMAFQNFALFPHMDAMANIASPLTARRTGREAIAETVGKVARMLKIDHVLHHKPKELSNGQKQRTALARALAGAPQILLLDDPLRNVDAKLRFEMRLELPRLLRSQDATVIYVTQDYKEAMALGDRIAVMNGHGIQQIGTPEDIYLRPANIEIARLFGDPVINLLDVVPEAADGSGGVQVRLSDQPVALVGGYAGTVGTDCVLGLRPEAMRFVDPGTPGAIPVEVEAETPLNEKTVTLTLTQRGREIMVSRPSGMPGPDQGTAYVAVDAKDALLFDRATGQRIAPGAHSPALQEDVA